MEYWQAATEYLSNEDKVLAKIIDACSGEGLQLKGDAFYTLARAIVGQQVSVKSAESVWRKLENIGQAEPEVILSHTDEELRSCGFSRQKINYIRNIAEYCLDRKPDESGFYKEMSDEEIIKDLTTIKGVGPWTAEMFLIFYLGRPDVLPLLDIGLLKACEKNYGIERSQTAELAKKWKPYRTVATWYLWRSLDPIAVSY